MPFLPITREEMKERGIEQFDFVYVIGDAYVDHSSFGPAIISRVLEANGYSVGIISQPVSYTHLVVQNRSELSPQGAPEEEQPEEEVVVPEYDPASEEESEEE